MTRAPLHLLLLSVLAAAGCGDKDDTGDVDTGSTDTGSVDASACELPTSLLDSAGEPTGYEQCDDGAINRASVVAPSDPGSEETCRGDEEFQDCTVDADCSAEPNGTCLTYDELETGAESCGCFYSCTEDGDCANSGACLPVGVVPTSTNLPSCMPAGCETNSDCDSGECGLSSYNDGCGYVSRLACRDAGTDECRADSDCDVGQTCRYDGSQWGCAGQECDIGRPLLIDGVARRAPAAGRADWSAALSETRAPPPAVRAALAARWLEIARLEHASVASFARFTLQMMALGAPPDLLAEIQAAAADEIRHAQLTFGLASRYAGTALGPGPLRLDDAMPALDVDSVLAGLIAEACLGETIGAAEAAEAARRCTDPAVRPILAEIAADEARHAGLAWKSLRWILTALAPDRRDRAAQLLEGAISTLLARPIAPSPELAPYGIAALSTAARWDIVAQVVWPAFHATAPRPAATAPPSPEQAASA